MVDDNKNINIRTADAPAAVSECPKCEKNTLVQVPGKQSIRFKCLKCGFSKKIDRDECFIATAVFEDPDHPVVKDLRRFRDRVLRPTRSGRLCVRAYYWCGPHLRLWVLAHPALKRVTRQLLVKFVTTRLRF